MSSKTRKNRRIAGLTPLFVICITLSALICCSGPRNAAPIQSKLANSITNAECVIQDERLRHFFRASPGEFRDEKSDAAYLAYLRQCSEAERVSAIAKFNTGQDLDFELRVKLSYISVKLGYEEEAAKADLLKLYASYPYDQNPDPKIDQVMHMICDVLTNHDKANDFLAASFRLNPNGAMATMLFDTYGAIFTNSPEPFLLKLGGQSGRTRRDVGQALIASIPNEVIRERLSKIPKSSKAYPVAREMERYVLQNKE